METINLNNNAEKWEVQPEDFPMPKLPETEQNTITPFREIFQYVEDLETVISNTEFIVHLLLASGYNLTYVCSFVNPEQANSHYYNAQQAQNEDERQYWIKQLKEERVNILDIFVAEKED